MLHEEISKGPSGFLGRWSVSRTVRDYRAGAIHTFEGTALLTNTVFEESGRLAIGEARFQTARIYKLGVVGDRLSIMFPNGADFIALGQDPSQKVDHICGRDSYRGRFFFRSVDEWAELWWVRGPQKRYSSLTRYSRIA